MLDQLNQPTILGIPLTRLLSFAPLLKRFDPRSLSITDAAMALQAMGVVKSATEVATLVDVIKANASKHKNMHEMLMDPLVREQIDKAMAPMSKTEDTAVALKCPHCHRVFRKVIPVPTMVPMSQAAAEFAAETGAHQMAEASTSK